MTDKELLELAAKAAGLKEYGFMGGSFVHVEDNTFVEWNPLTDDGDALRLAVKLDLLVNVWNAANKTCVRGATADGEVEGVEMHFSDPYAATRRAIVRATAEIGRTK